MAENSKFQLNRSVQMPSYGVLIPIPEIKFVFLNSLEQETFRKRTCQAMHELEFRSSSKPVGDFMFWSYNEAKLNYSNGGFVITDTNGNDARISVHWRDLIDAEVEDIKQSVGEAIVRKIHSCARSFASVPVVISAHL